MSPVNEQPEDQEVQHAGHAKREVRGVLKLGYIADGVIIADCVVRPALDGASCVRTATWQLRRRASSMAVTVHGQLPRRALFSLSTALSLHFSVLRRIMTSSVLEVLAS